MGKDAPKSVHVSTILNIFRKFWAYNVDISVEIYIKRVDVLRMGDEYPDQVFHSSPTEKSQ